MLLIVRAIVQEGSIGIAPEVPTHASYSDPSHLFEIVVGNAKGLELQVLLVFRAALIRIQISSVQRGQYASEGDSVCQLRLLA